jgi:hypothetical protein
MTFALADMGTPMASQAPMMVVETEWLIGMCPSLGLLQM